MKQIELSRWDCGLCKIYHEIEGRVVRREFCRCIIFSHFQSRESRSKKWNDHTKPIKTSRWIRNVIGFIRIIGLKQKTVKPINSSGMNGKIFHGQSLSRWCTGYDFVQGGWLSSSINRPFIDTFHSWKSININVWLHCKTHAKVKAIICLLFKHTFCKVNDIDWNVLDFDVDISKSKHVFECRFDKGKCQPSVWMDKLFIRFGQCKLLHCFVTWTKIPMDFNGVAVICEDDSKSEHNQIIFSNQFV